MIIFELIQNIALIVALAAIHRVFMARFEQDSLRYQILVGILFGGVGVIAMMTPLNLLPGIIIDGRSIILSIAGLFGGPIVAFIAAIISGFYRLWLGGSGSLVGVFIILESAAIGVGFNYLHSRSKIRMNSLVFWGFGILVNLIMLALLLTLPDGVGFTILTQIGIPIIILFPVATMLVCLLFLDSERQIRDRRALFESEIALRKAQQAAHLGSWALHFKQNRLELSDEMYHIIGIGKEFSRGNIVEVLRNAIHPDDHAVFEQARKSVIEEQKLQPLEFRIIWPDGSVHVLWVEAGELTLNQKGQPEVLSGIVLDVTEIRKSEELITRLANRFDLATQAARLGVWDWDIVNDNLVWDDRMYELYGVSNKEDFKGAYDAWLKGIHPEDRALSFEASQQALSGEKEYDTEFRVVWPNGTIRILKAYGQVIRETNGIPMRMTGINYDITESKQAEITLRESDEKHKKMIANISDVISIWGKDGKIIYKSPNIEKWFGWHPEDIVGTDGWATIHPDDLPRIQKEFHSLIDQDNSRKTVEYRYLCKDGNYKTIELTAVNLINDPSVNGILMNYHDISERKRSEERLLENKVRLKRAEKIGRIGNWEIDLKSNQIIWSDQVYELFGRDPKLGPPTSQEQSCYYSADTNKKLSFYSKHVVEHGEPVKDYEFQVNLADGRNSIFIGSMFPLKDNNGQVIKIFGIFQDITERKQIEEEVRTSHELLSRLTDQVPGVVYQYRLFPDGTSCFPFSSPGMEEIYECTPAEVHDDATPVFGRIHPDDYDQVVAAIQESARTLQLFHCEFRVVLPRQGLRWRICNSKPERMEDGGTLWYGIISDITDRKLAEQQINNQIIELHRWQNITLGREDRILQLKSEVNRLLSEIGRPPRYTSASETIQV